ncbi:RNA polymerase sigma factor [Cellulophaga fucicola]|uniref:RNA polymerase sigma factor n=1 Tax=Cellulophaga fucicola TaxID=76595 RepID=UPI003EB984F2
MNNVELINSLIKGEEKAFSFLISTYHKKLYVYALSLTNDSCMSQDIVQNVFLKVWEYRKKLNSNYSIKSFLYKSIYNEFVTQYHRNQSISALEKAYVDALNEITDNSGDIEIEKKIKIITEEINCLPKKCKQTFLLSKKEGLTNVEISEYLNISVKSVEANITRAYVILKEKVNTRIYKILVLFFYKLKRSLY